MAPEAWRLEAWNQSKVLQNGKLRPYIQMSDWPGKSLLRTNSLAYFLVSEREKDKF
jgi:hypothetical protein